MKSPLAVAVLALVAPTAYGLPAVQRSFVTIDAIGTGGYEADYYTSPNPINPEIHVLGVYETHSNHSFNNHPQGTARVHVRGSANSPVHLVLSSHEPVKWILDGPGTPHITSILLNGLYPAVVEGIDPAKVVNRSSPEQWLGAYAYAWPSASGGSNTPLLVQRVAQHFGAPISTFSGAYSASRFTVNLVPVPEPSAAGLSVLAAAALFRRRRGDCRRRHG